MKTPAITLIAAAIVAAAVSVISFAPAKAEPLQTSCPSEYAGGYAPDLRNAALSRKLAEICYSEFGVYHSGVTATPLFVGQHLTARRVADAQLIDRNDVFKAEARLPASDRAELAHYRGSGFDRGHMAPAADMATDAANDESFSLANMVPQYPAMNRGAWADIEETTRKLAKGHGEVFVVTGPAFIGSRLARVGGRVIVPSAVYKAVYLPSTGQASAWWADNSAPGGMEVISISELNSRIGADVFPMIPEATKATKVALPMPGGVGPAARIENRAENADGVTSPSTAVPEETVKGQQTWFERIAGLLLALIEALLRTLLRG